MVVAVILAGGKGIRSKQFSKGRPKVLLQLNQHSLLLRKLHDLARAGCSHAVLVAGSKSREIHRYLRTVSTPIPIRIVCERGAPAGTLAAFRTAFEVVGRRNFLLTYGDTVLEENPARLFRHGSSAIARMAISSEALPGIRMNVAEAGGYVENYASGGQHNFTHFDYGYTFFNGARLGKFDWPTGQDLGSLYQVLARQKLLEAVNCGKTLWEVGTLDGYRRTRRALRGKEGF